MQLLLKGMHDVDICKRVLCRTENNELLDLMDTVDYIAAEEASSASFNTLLQPHTIVAGKSTYARQKQAPAPSTTALRPPCKCPVCGGTQDCTLGDCSTLWKKWGSSCRQCLGLNHFAAVCRSQQTNPAAAPLTTPPATVAAAKQDADPITGDLITDPAVFYAMQTSAPASHTDPLTVCHVSSPRWPRHDDTAAPCCPHLPLWTHSWRWHGGHSRWSCLE